jgi:hypothetical protein
MKASITSKLSGYFNRRKYRTNGNDRHSFLRSTLNAQHRGTVDSRQQHIVPFFFLFITTLLTG